MTAVAERLVGRVTAAAQRNHGSSSEPERRPGGIEDFEFAFDTNGAVVVASDFGWHQNILSHE